MLRYILILLGLMIFNVGSTQIQKLFNTENPDSNYFGSVVTVNGDFALVQNEDHFLTFDERKYDLHIFKKENSIWKEIQALNTFSNYNYWKQKRSVISNNILVTDNFGLGGALDYFIYILKFKTSKFEYVDSLYLDNYLSNRSYKSIYGNWLMVQIENYVESLSRNYFYYYENDKWELKDSFNLNYLNDAGAMIKSIINENFAILPARYSLIIFKKKGEHWTIHQKLYLPVFYTYQQTLFSRDISMSPDEKWIAATVIDTTGIPYRNSSYLNIYKLTNDKWELSQIIRNIGEDSLAFARGVNIYNNDLLIGSPLDYGGKGTIYHYILKNDLWLLKGEIKPPAKDTLYGYFGSNIDRYNETVIVGAENDKTYTYAPGAAYIFQIPARDTLRAAICEGESYTFNDTVIYDAGHYTDTLLASYGVDSVVQLYLTVYPKEQIEIDTILCDNQQLIVGDSVLTEEGIYTITLQNQYGCDSIVTAKIEYDDIEVIDSITADYGCQNGEIRLSVEGNNPPYAFNWTGGQTGEYINGLSYGNYNVTITSQSGCVYDYDYEVGDSIPYLIPNAFFPNGQEDLNAIFKPYTAKDVHILSTEIYDRWGEKVFSGAEDEFWDGTYQGKMQSPGVYLYRIVIDSPCGEEVKGGQVVLLR